MWTPHFEAFVASARGKPQLWRTMVGTVVIFAVYGALFMAFVTVVGLVTMADGDTASQVWLLNFLSGRNPTGVVTLLLTFGFMALGAWIAARALHGRDFRSLVGPDVLSNFIPAAIITGLIGGASAAYAFLFTDIALEPNTPLVLFLTFLPAALIALLVQTGAEELVFRGYLQTQLAARFRSPIVWMLIPSLLFGALHLDFSDGGLAPNDGLIFAATTLVGLLTADLTRVTGGIGAAWGLHFVNNVQALLIVSLDDILSGLSIWKTPFGRDDIEELPLLLLQDMFVLVVIWAAIRLWLARRA
ncbi:CPBP family intramembrane glutamic endopeptidase [Jannaschia aquimarina]|uniref:CAAX amino terminal protease self-immunity n=1 Tax=Jannaschia aquimarina TaxID=935700 RepID=A0A0D1CNR9_9RHOB|nr:CPBP family intramembrane glutamic endopeptidase [Jannaschia aquimarina]KIT16357.1 CAAX amino terminal protease self- immunity [Jannaschia aquimarina]SNT25662.1 hypothetical protein SAMN05421775_10932 [Jannaschia aquimarina]